MPGPHSTRPGDVVRVPRTVARGPVAVITTARRRGGDVRLGAVTVDTRKVLLRAADFHAPPRPVARIELPAAADRTLQSIPALAISLEPAGGSPTGLPTGPVLYSGPVQRLY